MVQSSHWPGLLTFPVKESHTFVMLLLRVDPMNIVDLDCSASRSTFNDPIEVILVKNKKARQMKAVNNIFPPPHDLIHNSGFVNAFVHSHHHRMKFIGKPVL